MSTKNNKKGVKNDPEAIEINDRFFEDLAKIATDAMQGVDLFYNIDRLNKCLLSIDADKIILEDSPKAKSLDVFEIAVLRVKVCLLEKIIVDNEKDRNS